MGRGSRLRGALWLGWALPSADSRASDGGTAPPLRRPSRVLLPRPAGRPTTAGEARVGWGVGALPCGRRPLVFVRLQPPSSAPALFCPLDWPRILPSLQPLSLQDFQGAGSLTANRPSFPRAFLLLNCSLSPLLYPQTCNSHAPKRPGQPPPLPPAGISRTCLHPGTAVGGGAFPRRPPLAPVARSLLTTACALSACFCPVPPPCRVPVFGTQKPWQRPHLTPPPASLAASCLCSFGFLFCSPT